MLFIECNWIYRRELNKIRMRMLLLFFFGLMEWIKDYYLFVSVIISKKISHRCIYQIRFVKKKYSKAEHKNFHFTKHFKNSTFPTKSLIEPCPGCEAPYGYHNVMSLSTDTRRFSVSRIRRSCGLINFKKYHTQNIHKTLHAWNKKKISFDF